MQTKLTGTQTLRQPAQLTRPRPSLSVLCCHHKTQSCTKSCTNAKTFCENVTKSSSGRNRRSHKFKATRTRTRTRIRNLPTPLSAFHAPKSGQRQHFYGKARSFSSRCRRRVAALFVAIPLLFLLFLSFPLPKKKLNTRRIASEKAVIRGLG